MEDLYLDDLAENTGWAFSEWAEAGVNMHDAVTEYMKSDYRYYADKRYAVESTEMWYEQKKHFNYTSGNFKYDSILCEWLGQFYTVIQSKTGKLSRDLIDILPFDKMYVLSRTLHDLDMDLAVDRVIKTLD
ncbi:MAG: hypothetical protein IJ593_00910 [Lachnospiraceae bacterium]|nr:hypothetical protein [Lachnospiraceae bacterium]